MKSLKQFIMAIIFFSLTCCFFLSPVNAKAPMENSEYTCPTDPEINPEDIINATIIDGELYIDVLYEIDPSKPMTRATGKCPSSSRKITETMSRNELVEIRDDLNAGKGWAAILGTIVGVGNPIIGAVVGFTLSNNALYNTVQSALDTKGSRFNMISTFACESVDMGSRGWVHRYRLSNVTIVKIS